MVVIISFNIEIADFHYLDQFQSRVTESSNHETCIVCSLITSGTSVSDPNEGKDGTANFWRHMRCPR